MRAACACKSRVRASATTFFLNSSRSRSASCSRACSCRSCSYNRSLSDLHVENEPNTKQHHGRARSVVPTSAYLPWKLCRTFDLEFLRCTAASDVGAVAPGLVQVLHLL